MFDSSPWLLYLGVLIGPFIQEDAAVLAAASLSVNEMASWPKLYIVIIIGLFLSDAWKYWIGWGALRYKRAQAFVEKRHVASWKEKVQQHTIVTLFSARFVPLTRVPTYVACGLFGISYVKYCFLILLTAILYVTVIFLTFHILGELVGESLKWILPIIGLSAAAIYIGYLLLKRKRSGP